MPSTFLFSLKSHFDEVVKSEKRVPTPITRSASLATTLAALPPVTPIPPRLSGFFQSMIPLPACVSLIGILYFLANSRSSFSAPLYLTPPPQTMIGFLACLIRAVALSSCDAEIGLLSILFFQENGQDSHKPRPQHPVA